MGANESTQTDERNRELVIASHCNWDCTTVQTVNFGQYPLLAACTSWYICSYIFDTCLQITCLKFKSTTVTFESLVLIICSVFIMIYEYVEIRKGKNTKEKLTENHKVTALPQCIKTVDKWRLEVS